MGPWPLGARQVRCFAVVGSSGQVLLDCAPFFAFGLIVCVICFLLFYSCLSFSSFESDL